MVANPRQQVRVRGANVPMNTEEPQPTTPPAAEPQPVGFLDRFNDWFGSLAENYRRNHPRYSGWPPPGSDDPSRFPSDNVENIIRGTGTRAFQSPPVGSRGLFGLPEISSTPSPPTANIFAPNSSSGMGDVPGLSSYMPETVQDQMTFDQFMSGRGFDESPYRDYMNFLASQDEETMARINSLYAQLADEAQANMERIDDIYGSAQITSGDVYGSAAQNIEGAYGSAQQQAADQMARLGIEAAAPAVINPMALSQAEAIAGVESAGAGALDALTRYGASAQDFGSQMGQVAQQQGLEVSNQILRDMAQRQAEAAFQMEQARANYNPYASALQEMEARQMFNQMQNPEVDWRQQQAMADFAYREEQDAIDNWERAYDRNLRENGGNEAAALEATVKEAARGTLGIPARNAVLSNPDYAQYLN